MRRTGYDPEGEELAAPVIRALREAYAPPAGEGYWEALESSILSRVSGVERPAWWSPFRDWIPAGLAAAGIALLAAGIALYQPASDDSLVAYESAMSEAAPLPVRTLARTVGGGGREATLHFLLPSTKE